MLTAATGCGSGGGQGGAGNGGASGDTIRIGGLAPLTGDVSVYGVAVDNGVKMAVEELNAGGGVLGKQIDYIVYDEKGDATEAVNAYNKLVQSDKVVAIVGDVTSKPTLAVAQQAVKDKIPMITASGTAENITAAGENIFRACFIDPFQGELMASYASKKLGKSLRPSSTTSPTTIPRACMSPLKPLRRTSAWMWSRWKATARAPWTSRRS